MTITVDQLEQHLKTSLGNLAVEAAPSRDVTLLNLTPAIVQAVITCGGSVQDITSVSDTDIASIPQANRPLLFLEAANYFTLMQVAQSLAAIVTIEIHNRRREEYTAMSKQALLLAAASYKRLRARGLDVLPLQPGLIVQEFTDVENA